MDEAQLPARPPGGHKGTFGTVAVFGGSISGQKIMLGGPAFAAVAALRTGVGLVNFVGEKELLEQLIQMVPQAVGVELTESFSGKWQSVIIGPGLGVDKSNAGLINDLLSLELPTVLDADGLNTMSEFPKLAEKIHDKCVLTPHPKEFERLSEALDVKNAEELAKKFGCTVVLKGSKTYVVDSKNNWTEKVENPVLATGGTGDVLSGLIGGLLAQYADKLSVFECAKLGVIIHSKAAEKWRAGHGSGGLIIEELLERVPETLDELRKTD